MAPTNIKSTAKGNINIVNKKKKRIDESNERNEKASNLENIVVNEIFSFSDFPISERTLKGLCNSGFTKPTDIQKEGITFGLQGHDILAAAKTGSGKTLAFLVPILELLWHEKWSNMDSLGALIISPTRELALQTYDVLRKIGKYHDFSAGLIIGGKDLVEEQQRISHTNIIIGTPGRILQHFDETPSFSCFDLKILVLDEADRLLDLGFSNAINAIIENLPQQRQTVLYSATQTKSVRDLARLSLVEPKYVAVHESSKYSTPKKLLQNFITVELQDKINFLFSFVRNHLKSKSIVFLSSCKQVKFIYEIFRKLRPGIPLTALYGKQKQLKRVAIYNRFCSVDHAVLFATDIAARGLDFPAVSWVIQFDCPENPDTYIHRVGRTARYEKGGQALLMLLPSEESMIPKLIEKKIPIHELKSNPKKITSIQGKLQSFCIQDQEIKHWAQKSIISYARSIYLQADKTVFDVTKLPLDAFSVSCGLMAAPKLQFMKKMVKRVGPIDNTQKKKDTSQTSTTSLEKLGGMEPKINEIFGVDDDDDEDVLIKKNSDLHHENIQMADEVEVVEKKQKSKTRIAKKIIRKKIKVGSKILFDDNGDVLNADTEERHNEDYDDSDGIDILKAKEYMQNVDRIDREKEKQRIKLKHKEMKRKERSKRKMEDLFEIELDVSDKSGISEEDDDFDRKTLEKDPPRKREKISSQEDIVDNVPSTLDEDEKLALHLLGAS